jgi:hypothetical protein
MTTEHTRKLWKAKALHRRDQSHLRRRNGSGLPDELWPGQITLLRKHRSHLRRRNESGLPDEQMIDPAALSSLRLRILGIYRLLCGPR